MSEEEEKEEKDVMTEIEEMLGKEAAERIEKMKHGDSVLSGGKAAYESVMKILAKAVKTPDAEYRQALLLTTFLDRDDALRVVAALDERRRYGVDIAPVVDLITAWQGVVGAQGGRANLLLQGQIRQEISTNLPSAVKRAFLNKKRKDEPLE